MRRIAVVIAAIGLAVAVYYGTHNRTAKPTREPDTRSSASPAPALILVDLSGNKIDTQSYAGKVVLINFWAAWCTPCAEEVPQLVALQDKYRDQGFQVIGISMEDSDSTLRDFYRKYKMNYPVAAGSAKIAESYGGILGLPTTFLIGRDGRIRAKYPGLADFAKLEQEIVVLLRTNQ
ncbi:MAG: TlpA family protein disulfide reductase [Acidobacteriia bacterium]|nr:TlpA family protein disulfide reductase [Terriglobia bacterium]